MNYDCDEDYEFLLDLFEKANASFLKIDKDLFYDDVSERTLCGALKRHLENKKWQTKISHYKVDVEYNRNEGRVKTIVTGNEAVVQSIVCDLIIHSRGKNPSQVSPF
ncbi:MAG: hypothetical protein LBG88_00615 [Christensenellaceae bacterium]|jgi:hypothetical protein|nr:hypothetical protein [Christensenellaceae bacterium]